LANFYTILFNFPRVTNNFKPAYDGIQWLNNEDDFKRWCSELLDINGGRWNASTTKQVICTIEYVWWWQVFLCKHLLINWQWGEAYFAESYWIMKCHLMWAVAMGSRNRL
jgi:deoxyribodipyrimidine photo-lyase